MSNNIHKTKIKPTTRRRRRKIMEWQATIHLNKAKAKAESTKTTTIAEEK